MRTPLMGLSAAVIVLAAAYASGSRQERRAQPEPAWISTSPLDRPAPAAVTWPDAEWSSAPPSAPFAAAVRRIERDLPEVRALLIVQHGRLVHEQYFKGASATTAFNVKSVTKSVVSALAGIAIRDGHIKAVDEPITQWLGADMPAGTHADVRRVTLRHLLTMTAGWQWRENGPETSAWIASQSPTRFMLARPRDAAPGERFTYSTGVAHLVSVILSRATGTNLKAYADRQLFTRIGVRAGRWGQDAQGHYEGGSELHLTARDMARFGWLYVNGGRWRGDQVVPRAWVLESTVSRGRVDYGYYWNLLPREWGGVSVNALGYGGQMIALVPAADAVVVVTSTIDDPANAVMALLREEILPVLRD